MKFSQVVRTALEEFIKKVEKEKLEKEMIEACKFYFSVDREISYEWRKSERKLINSDQSGSLKEIKY